MSILIICWRLSIFENKNVTTSTCIEDDSKRIECTMTMNIDNIRRTKQKNQHRQENKLRANTFKYYPFASHYLPQGLFSIKKKNTIF